MWSTMCGFPWSDVPLIVSQIDLVEETNIVLTVRIHSRVKKALDNAILKLDRHLVGGVIFGNQASIDSCVTPRQ
jgi:hypothetical protein